MRVRATDAKDASDVKHRVLRAAGMVGEGVEAIELPVDLMKEADRLGVQVYYATFNDPDVSGIVITDPDRVPAGATPGKNGTIFLKKDEFPPRSRFTLAHELGHVALGHTSDGVLTDFYRGRTNGHQNPQERDANKYAADLLMPREIFVRMWPYAAEEELAIVFGVSAPAVSVRASALGLKTRYDH